MRLLIGLVVTVGLFGQANNNNPSMVLLGADGPGAVSGVGTTVVGNVGSNTLYYWVVPVYPIGQGKISQQAVVGNAPGVLSVTNYVRVSWNKAPTATAYYVLRTTTPTIPSTCTCLVTGPANISTVNDQGGALTSFTYSPAGNAIATILLDNQNYATPTLLATPPFGGGSGMVYPGAGVANSSGIAWGASYTVGTGNNNLVQLNSSAQLPAVSAALLTNFPTLNQSTSGNAGTATALAAGGTSCGAGTFATGVSASGNATGCAVPAGTGAAGVLLSGSANPGTPILTIVQSKAGSSDGNALAYTSSVTAGNLLVAVLGSKSGPGTFAVSDTLGNLWTEIGFISTHMQVWATVTASSGANTVTWTGSSGNPNTAITEISGLSITTDSTQFTSPSPGAITTTVAYDLILTGAYSQTDSGSLTTSGSTIVLVTANNYGTIGIGYQIVPTVSTVTASLSMPGTGYFGSVAFKATPVSSPGNNGDWWLNTTTGVLWGPKTGGVWSLSTFDLLPTAGESKTNCSSITAPAVCGAASSGSVLVAAAGTTVVVNTTAVTANSQIFVMFDASLGTKLGVTCNVSTALAVYGITGRVAATSFTITTTSPITNPACFSYLIVN